MPAVALLSRAELRRRWPVLVVLGLLAGVVSGVVLGAGVGARRSATAFDRLHDRTGYWDAEVAGLPAELLDEVGALPMVAATWLQTFDVGLVTSRDEVTFLGIQAGLERPSGFYDPLVVEGRMWDPSAVDELVLSERATAVLGLHVGDTFDFAGATNEQFAGFLQGIVPNEPEGPRVTFEVVGIIRDPFDSLPTGSLRILGTPAYERAHGAEVGGMPVLTVRLHEGAAGIGRFRAALGEVLAASDVDLPFPPEVTSVHEQRVVVDRATAVAVQALLAFALVAAVAGLVVVSQALVRDLLGPTADAATWTALGITARERLLAVVVPRAVVVAVGAAVATVGAYAMSPLMPVGVSRGIEPAPGLEPSWALLAVGALAAAGALAAVVGTCAAVVLRRSTQGARAAVTRPSGVVARAGATGLPLPFVLGTRFALQPGRSSVPTRSALTGAVLGVTGLVAAVTVVASLDRLVTTPARYGWGHDVTVADVEEDLVDDLVADERHASVVLARQVNVELAGEEVLAIGLDVLKGGLRLPVLEGRPPGGPGEVALGPDLMGELGLAEGDVVELPADGGGTARLEVVGTVLTEDIEAFRRSVVLTSEGLDALATGEDGYRSAWLSWDEGIDAGAATAALAREKEIALPELPADVGNLSQVRGVVRTLAAFLAVLALAATSHAVFVTAARRRRELGILRALGVTGRQLARSIRWMSLVLLAIGLGVGAPLGVVTAGFVWRRIAGAVGVAGDISVPAAALAASLPVAVVLGLLLAVLPAHRAAQLGAARALRVE